VDSRTFSVEAIGVVRSSRDEAIDDDWDSVEATSIQTAARRPRSNPGWPEVGIFAQRAKMRPNRLGVSVCRLLKIDGLTLHVDSLDAIDGSPVLDLKPYMREFGPRGEVGQPPWSSELMAGYW
jgi:tRNA (Thr-GGU) A37 N-methylase